MVKIIADIGATASKWGVVNKGDIQYPELRGFNAYSDDLGVLSQTITELCDVAQIESPKEVTEVRLFGAGMFGDNVKPIESMIADTFPHAKDIEIGDDVLGTCKAVSPGEEAMIVMMGTGTGHCYWDGASIAKQVPALGSILGDQGSGYDIGKSVLEAGLLGEFTAVTKEAFAEKVTSYDDVADYIHEPSKVAQWARFAKEHIGDPVVQGLLRDCFDRLANDIIRKQYKMLDKNYKLTGSIAVNFKDQIVQSFNEIVIPTENIEVISTPVIQRLAPQYL